VSARAVPANVDAETGEIIEEPNPDVEPDEEIEGEDAEPEQEPEAPSEPSSLKLIEDMEKALAAEAKRHSNALGKALGEHWVDFQECPLCQIAGYAMPYSPGEVEPAQRDAIARILGEDVAPTYRKHPRYRMCAACAGMGKVDTGSLNPGFDLVPCDDCSGNGYVDSTVHQLTPQAQYVPPAQPWEASPQPPAYPGPNVDQWGRQPGHPHWGLEPASVGL
jgi:hypothetical protein